MVSKHEPFYDGDASRTFDAIMAGRFRYNAWCLALVGYTLLLLQVAAQQCGQVQVRKEALIFGGTISKSGRWPWHVALFHLETPTTTSYKCGGTIINRETVLTAYHCVAQGSGPISPTRLQVRAGMFDLSVIDRNAQIIKVFDVIAPPGANELYIDEDIAILKLQTLFTYDNFVQPVCIRSVPQDIEGLVGTYGTVVGWGWTEHNATSTTLREARLPVASVDDCLKSDRALFSQVLTKKVYCAGSRNGTLSCNGDSGGGMYFQMGDYWFLRGITSFSASNELRTVCNPRGYAGYTDVSKYLDWLREQTVKFDDPLQGQQPQIVSPIVNSQDSRKMLRDWIQQNQVIPSENVNSQTGKTTLVRLSVDPETRNLLQNNKVVLKVPLNGRPVESLF